MLWWGELETAGVSNNPAPSMPLPSSGLPDRGTIHETIHEIGWAQKRAGVAEKFCLWKVRKVQTR